MEYCVGEMKIREEGMSEKHTFLENQKMRWYYATKYLLVSEMMLRGKRCDVLKRKGRVCGWIFLEMRMGPENLRKR